MAKKVIRTGTTADPTGDSLKTAFTKVNDNFTELYNALGLGDNLLNLGNFKFTGSTISLDDPEDSTLGITIDTMVNINSDLTVGGDILPETANGGNLGSAAKPWKSLYVSNNTVFLGGIPISLDTNTNELKINNVPISQTLTYADIPNVPTDIGDLTDTGNLLFDGDYGSLSNTPTIPTLTSQLTNDLGFLTTAVLNNGLDADLKGSVFADDSTVMVDGVSGVLRANVNVSNTWTVTTGDKTWSFIYGDVSEGTIPTLEFPGNLQATGAQTAIYAPANDLSGNWGMSIDAANSPYYVDIGEISGSNYWRFDGNGGITFPDTTVQTTAWTGVANIARNIESENDVSIRVNLSDSTQRVWRFGEDGNLNLAGNLQFPNGAEIRDVNGDLRLRAAPGDAAQLQGLDTNGSVDSAVKAFYDNGSFVTINTNIDAGAPEHVWTFDYNGKLTLPGILELANGAQIFNTAGVDDSITIGATGTPGTTTFNGSGFFIDDTFFHKAIQEKFSSLQDATGVVTHNCANGHIFYHTSPDANWTVNLTNFSLVTNYATAITIIISQGGTGYYPNALQIGGAAQTINWQGNTTPTPSTNRVDVVTFSIFLTGSGYTVLGQLTGF